MASLIAPASGAPQASHHVIVINISEDNEVQAILAVELTTMAGVRDQIPVVFADLSDDDEWPGTAERAATRHGPRRQTAGRESCRFGIPASRTAMARAAQATIAHQVQEWAA